MKILTIMFLPSLVTMDTTYKIIVDREYVRKYRCNGESKLGPFFTLLLHSFSAMTFPVLLTTTVLLPRL